MNNSPARPPITILINKRRGSGTLATLPSRKVIQFPVRRGQDQRIIREAA